MSVGTPALLVAGALGVWLGLQAARMQLLAVVWNVAEDAPTTQLGLVAAGIWAVGLLGFIPARLLGDRAAWMLGALFAVLVALRQTIAGEVPTAIFSIAAWIAWLWWLPAFLHALARRGATAVAPAAVLVGLGAQVATQAALHGSDLHAAGGAIGAIGGVVLALGFVLALRVGLRAPEARSDAGAAWGALALGPFLFLQMTVLVNLGRLELLSGADLTVAALVASAGVAAALVALRWRTSRVARAVAAIVSILLLAAAQAPAPWAALALVPAQVGLALLLAGAFAAPGAAPGSNANDASSTDAALGGAASGIRVGVGASQGRAYLGAAAGAVLLFVLLFLFYSGEAVPALWPVAALLVGAASLRGSVAAPFRQPRPLAAAIALGVVAVLASVAPYPAPDRAAAPREGVRVLDYNIHQGIDRFGVPGMAAIAEVIEGADADLVALQEVNRTWDIAGGVDNFAWLRWRFPGHTAVYGPMHGDFFGNAILSRFPVKEWGWERFPLGPSKLARGYVWAVVATPAGDALFLSTHFTPYNRGQERAERVAQARLLLAFWKGRAPAILAGDFNDDAESEAVRTLVGGGLRDVLAAHGLGKTRTFISTGTPFATASLEKLDYIFTSPGVTSTEARILETVASDHLPLVATLRLR